MREKLPIKNAAVTPQTREEISWRAYMHFVNSGGRHGHDQEHWFLAETEVLLEHLTSTNLSDNDFFTQGTAFGSVAFLDEKSGSPESTQSH
ncbi:MAG TPA: DUF2934 domain-containing protein [Verrucomicrobiae bacterium]